jgi:DNA/RNA endonuclease YhcR with UshA esterase domain
VLRMVALLAGIAGILFLHLYISDQEPPLIRIGEISPLNNFSTVRIRGILKSDARQLRSGSALYRVDDGSGVLSVFLIFPPVEQLPKAGSRVTVEGSLSVGVGNNIRMRVFSEKQVVVDPVITLDPPAGAFPFSEITAERKGDRITVVGQVVKIWNPENGSRAPHKVVMVDSSGTLDIIYWFSPALQVAMGDVLKVSGRVEFYQGRVQLKVWESASVSVLSEL